MLSNSDKEQRIAKQSSPKPPLGCRLTCVLFALTFPLAREEQPGSPGVSHKGARLGKLTGLPNPEL